ncbi:MAG: hypothetical protein O3A20_09690 [Planctomycetota bacterium]|nr:hypothetical protein [Planctomycetota bacterium]
MKHIPHFLAIAVSPLLLALPSFAQNPGESSLNDSVSTSLQEWNAATGREWRLTRSAELGGAGRFLWGASRQASFTPQDDADWYELARIAFDDAYGMFGISDAELEPVSVHLLPLAQIGTTDKVSVEFRQTVRGIPVVLASVHALFATNGDLLALDNNALPGAVRLNVKPIANLWEAAAAARRHFEGAEGREAAFLSEPSLVIVGELIGKTVAPRLAWSVEVRNEIDPSSPAALQIYVAADDNSLSIVKVEELIHHQQITGHVESYATPGTSAHRAANPPTIHPMPFLTLTSSAGNVTTDINGDFTFNSASPVTFTAKYSGPYCRVENQAAANHSVSQSFTPGVPATLTMNTGQTEWVTSEASCYDSVQDMRNWLRSIDPGDTHLNFQVVANANLNQTCNAYFNGNSINMYRAGGSCNNTGFSTVVTHEEGHWANVLYGSGNGSDGFGEGNADVWSMYIYDTAVVGEYFFTNGGFIRTGNNTRQFCGDTNRGCYGQVHTDGEVLMGALWKVRDRLNTSLGNAAGDLTADTLFVNWMNAYNDGQIHSIIEEHWLVLDDNDANINNGTPNYGDIDGGFRAQGFPGYALQLIDLQHSPLPDTQNEAGPYLAAATITSLVGSTITGAELTYAVDGGATQTMAMANVGGANWEANIPGQLSPVTVRYHLEAHDALNNDLRAPLAGEFEFVVGVKTVIYANGFEGATDEGWTHAQLATQDDWMRGTPNGSAGDPAGAYAGAKVWGNDLAPSGYNGAYQPNVHNYLRSPVIDCSGKTGVHLRFQRWLTVEEGIYDQAKVEVNGVVVWANPLNGDLIDTAWMPMDLDISQWADNNANVQITYRLQSDGGVNYGGWNIDEFEVYVLDPVPGGGDSILLSGPTTVPSAASSSWSVTQAPNTAPWYLLASKNNTGVTHQGHSFDIGTPVFVMDSGTTSGAGAASASAFIPGALSGRTVYLEIASRDAGQWYDSNLLSVSVL